MFRFIRETRRQPGRRAGTRTSSAQRRSAESRQDHRRGSPSAGRERRHQHPRDRRESRPRTRHRAPTLPHPRRTHGRGSPTGTRRRRLRRGGLPAPTGRTGQRQQHPAVGRRRPQQSPPVPTRRADRRRSSTSARRLLRRHLRRRPRRASMQRLAGAATFPAQVTAPVAVGPEIPREGVAAIRAIFEALLPGATVAPLQLRGRAIGILLAVGTNSDQLRDLANEAAIALALAPPYSDHIDTVRRTRPTSPAAEIQQNLFPHASRASAEQPSPATSCPDMRSAATGSTTPKTPAAPGSESPTQKGKEQPPPASAPSPSERSAPPAANQTTPPKASWQCTKCCSKSATAPPPPQPPSDTGTLRHQRFAGSPPATSHPFASPATASSSGSKATFSPR